MMRAMKAYRIVEFPSTTKALPRDTWLRTRDAAAWLGVSNYTVLRWVEEGKVAAIEEPSAGRYGKRTYVWANDLMRVKAQRS